MNKLLIFYLKGNILMKMVLYCNIHYLILKPILNCEDKTAKFDYDNQEILRKNFEKLMKN